MSQPYQFIQNEERWASRFRTEEMKYLQNMGSAKQATSGSVCDRTHLFAFHAIIKQRGYEVLPVLKAATAVEIYDHNGQITKFINGDGQKNEGLEHQLSQTLGASLGLVWSSLQRTKERRNAQADPQQFSRPLSKRQQQMPNPDYNPAPASSPGSASGSTSGSTSGSVTGSTGSSSTGSDQSFAEGVKQSDLQSEDYTVRLITSVLRHILHNAQRPNALEALEYREKETLTLTTTASGKFVATDDGGLRHRTRKARGVTTANFFALVEAKKALYKDKNGIPFFRDEVLAQISCEAILAKISEPDNVCGDSVVVIHAACHHVCFVEFNMSEAYGVDFRKGRTPADPLNIHMSKWFDIATRDGRLGIVKNMQGLINKSLE
ncbi:hypothetical protein FPSE_10530 [Fusarium pseudograminearum CS3096]|uniref:Uncharacterized protein n=1 Tax=Fusarium pseudograminearum (strain CS3096) TaxID=1028729 RepID=K3V791_FUSPC|nr:hypothetical protein FPSE_10530 [Fusarium pseudograminearum CS3096]EKJ69277.1 hypothetical protein FPSE_10530 [Fusarium pseudograminearum CS3096]KAF0638587.1 hypothetical protein FPSE5266_10530 [Fusarium pseudograminearum]